MNLEDYSTYVIDFERLNLLTYHPNDGKQSGSMYPVVTYSISRKFLKTSLEVFETQFMKRYTPNEKDNKIFNILHYNKVIISPADIRNSKIEGL